MRRLLIGITLWLMTGIAVPAAAAAGTAIPMQPQGTPSPQQFGVRLADVPAAEANNPRALRYIVDYLPTGTTIHHKILINNDEAGTVSFTVYPDAAQISHGLFAGDAGETRSELTGWITVQHPVIRLRSGTSATDMITIKVPRGATRGEHYGVIWVQQTAHTQAGNGLGIDEVSRVGVRIYLAIGRGGAPPVSFAIVAVTGYRSAGGQPSILARVADTGGRAVDLNGSVRLADGPDTMRAGPFPARQIITLAPGQSGNLTFTPGRSLPSGPWQATVTVVSGLTTHTATKAIQFSAVVTASHPGPGLAFWAGLALCVVVVAFVILIFVRQAMPHRRAAA